jgi:hypothetical protein
VLLQEVTCLLVQLIVEHARKGYQFFAVGLEQGSIEVGQVSVHDVQHDLINYNFLQFYT